MTRFVGIRMRTLGKPLAALLVLSALGLLSYAFLQLIPDNELRGFMRRVNHALVWFLFAATSGWLWSWLGGLGSRRTRVPRIVSTPLLRGWVVLSLALTTLIVEHGWAALQDGLLACLIGSGTGLFLLLHYCGGRRLLSWRFFTGVRAHMTELEFLIVSTGLMLGLHATIFYALASLGASVRWTCASLLVLLALFARASVLASLRRIVLPATNSESHGGRYSWMWWGAFGTLALQLLLFRHHRVASPPIMFDATWLHLAAVKSYVVRDAMDFLPQLRSAHLIPLGQCQFTPLYWLFGELGPKWLEGAYFAGVGACTFALARRAIPNASANWGLLAALTVLSTPLFMGLGGICYLGLIAMNYMLIAFILALEWSRGRDLGENRRGRVGLAVLLGLFLGFSFLGKVQAWGIFLPVGLVVLPGIYSSLRAGQRRLPLLHAGLALAAFLLIVAPNLARNYLLMGNPMAPFLSGFFGFNDDIMSKAELEQLSRAVADLGMGKTVGDFFLLPWRLTLHPENFAGSGTWTLGPIWLAALPLVVLGSSRRSAWWGLPLVLSFALPWFLLFQELRYVMYMLPAVAILMCSGLHRLAHNRASMALASAGAVALFSGLVPGSLLDRTHGTLGLRGNDRLNRLDTYIPGHRSVLEFARHANRRVRVFHMDLDSARLFFPDPGNLLGDHFGKYRFSSVFRFSPSLGFRDGETVVERLREWNIDNLMIGISRRVDVDNLLLRSDPFLARHLRLESAVGGALRYSVGHSGTGPSEIRLPTKQWLRDTDLVLGEESAWTRSVSDVQSGPTPGSVQIPPGASLSQTIQLEGSLAGSLFQFRVEMHCASDSEGFAWMQVVWAPPGGYQERDAQGRRLYDQQTVMLRPGPNPGQAHSGLFGQSHAADRAIVTVANRGPVPLVVRAPSFTLEWTPPR